MHEEKTTSKSIRVPDSVLKRAEAWRLTQATRPNLSAALVALIRLGLDAQEQDDA